MILLYSVHDIRCRFTRPPTYCFSLDREPQEQEQSHAKPQKTPQSEEQAYLIVQRASWSVLTSVISELMACVTEEGQNLPLETRHTKKKNPFSSETGSVFIREFFYFYAAFCLFESRCLAADCLLISNVERSRLHPRSVDQLELRLVPKALVLSSEQRIRT